jgi:hypothetical protein
MKNSARGDSSTGSELKAVEEACREASRTVEPCELCASFENKGHGRGRCREIPPFSWSVGERKLMKHSVVKTSSHETRKKQLF